MKYIKMNKYISQISLVLLLMTTGVVFGNDTDPIVVKEVVSRLNRQITQNEWNDAHGLSNDNNYIIDIRDIDLFDTLVFVKQRGNTSFVTDEIQNEANTKLITLSDKAKNSIKLYFLLNGQLLQAVPSSESGTQSDEKNKDAAKDLLLQIYNNSDLVGRNNGRNALVAIAPVNKILLDTKTAAHEDKLKVSYLRYRKLGKAFVGLKGRNIGGAGNVKYSSGPSAAFAKHVDAYIAALENYSGESTTEEIALIDPNKFNIVNQLSLDEYANNSKIQKDENYLSDIDDAVTELNSMKSSNQYVHLSELLNNIDPLASLVIEDKIKALNQETEGEQSIYVISKKVSYYLSKNEWIDFSRKIKEKSSLTTNDLLIAIPFHLFDDAPIQYATGALGVKDVIFPFPSNYGLGQNSQELELVDLLAYFNTIYKEVPKPFTIVDYLINFDGFALKVESRSQNKIIGRDHVLLLRASYDALLLTYNNELANRIREDSDQPVNKYENIDLFQIGKKYDYLDINALNIKESYIRSYEPQIISKAFEAKLQHVHTKIDLGSTNISDASWDKPQDPITFAIDILSLVTSPVGGDYAFDLLGAAYAYYSGDIIGGNIYSASAMLPFASGGGAKLVTNTLTDISKLSTSIIQSNKQVLFKLAFKSSDDNIAKLLLKQSHVDDLLSNPILLSKIEVLDPPSSSKLLNDFLDSDNLLSDFALNDELVNAWKKMDDLGTDIIPDALRKDPNFLSKFDDVAKNNNLGLDADGISDVLKSPSLKVDASTGLPLKWDNPDGVLDAIKRTTDSGVDGVSISHKKFPTPADGNDSFVLKNAKQYQGEASGDAGLSFDKDGVSFDNVTADGKLVDRKYGHGPSVFNADGTVKNRTRADSILEQGQRQIDGAGGAPVRWEVSTELGADGIQDLFDNAGIDIEVVHIAQQTIIN